MQQRSFLEGWNLEHMLSETVEWSATAGLERSKYSAPVLWGTIVIEWPTSIFGVIMGRMVQ